MRADGKVEYRFRRPVPTGRRSSDPLRVIAFLPARGSPADDPEPELAFPDF